MAPSHLHYVREKRTGIVGGIFRVFCVVGPGTGIRQLTAVCRFLSGLNLWDASKTGQSGDEFRRVFQPQPEKVFVARSSLCARWLGCFMASQGWEASGCVRQKRKKARGTHRAMACRILLAAANPPCMPAPEYYLIFYTKAAPDVLLDPWHHNRTVRPPFLMAVPVSSSSCTPISSYFFPSSFFFLRRHIVQR